MTTLAPKSEAELAEMVADAAGRGAPLEVTGGRTRQGLGRPVQAEATLSTRGISGISLYEPGALTLVVKAGTPVSEVEETLAAEGQMLPFEPMDHRAILRSEGEPTIGGMVACAVSGPRRLKAGACRDSMIGVRLVDGEGTVIKNGGRVMKNVTGYDLVKLMAGSYGTLGVLTEIGFKVLPKPQAEITLKATGLDDAKAVGAMAEALGSPFDVSGAAHIGAGASDAVTQIRIEGLTESVTYRSQELIDLLGADWTAHEGTDSARAWEAIKNVTPLADREGAVWRVSVKPSDGPNLIAALREKIDVDAVVYDWGGGLVWLATPEEGDLGAVELRVQTAALGGHATLIRASAVSRAAVDVFDPEPAPLQRISAGLRAKFDPKGILNPGRMRA
ncbi:MAG: glycolate oxidase subunit GlcE [Pseudomonadota bacterium]